MAQEPVRVTDHAVLRYMERAMDLNIEIVRDHIASICAGPAAVGAVCVRSEGVRFEIVNNAVTTVTPDRANPSNTSRERNQRHIERTERDRIEGRNGIDTPRPLFSPRARAVAGADAHTVILDDPFAVIKPKFSGGDWSHDAGLAGFPAGTFTDADPSAG